MKSVFSDEIFELRLTISESIHCQTFLLANDFLESFQKNSIFGIERINPGYFPLIYCNSLYDFLHEKTLERIVLVSLHYTCVYQKDFIFPNVLIILKLF